jgi:N-carbamoyl-L-amino-acid hydrolase
MGNMFATRPGSDPEALPVYVGSHLDTQPTGGKYDGILGVLGGLEIINTLNDLNIKTKTSYCLLQIGPNEEGTPVCSTNVGIRSVWRSSYTRMGI